MTAFKVKQLLSVLLLWGVCSYISSVKVKHFGVTNFGFFILFFQSCSTNIGDRSAKKKPEVMEEANTAPAFNCHSINSLSWNEKS